MLEQESNIEMEQVTAVSSFTTTPPNIEGALETYEKQSSLPLPSVKNNSKWAIVKTERHRIAPRVSYGEVKLRNIINELNIISRQEQEARENKEIPVTNFWSFVRVSRRRLVRFLQQTKFHYTIILLVLTDLIVVLVDLVLGMLPSTFLFMNDRKFDTITLSKTLSLPEIL
jgi:hypothetical protein